MPAQSFSYVLGLATIFGDILALVLFVLLFLDHPLRRTIVRFSLWGMWLIALGGTIVSLIYSEYFRFAPCNLCWYQRALLYPQAIILAVALWVKDKGVARYVAWLSALGMLFAFYNHGLQMGWFPEGAICGSTGISCAKIYALQFGFVTIPWMAFTGFLVSFLLALHAWRARTT
jgi:disulfide bond formation protein DsbB